MRITSSNAPCPPPPSPTARISTSRPLAKPPPKLFPPKPSLPSEMTMTQWIDACATAGKCTHEDVHLSGGLVMDHVIECPKHNGQFDYRTGEAKRAPVCVNLKTYPVKVEGARVFIQVA